MTSFLIQTWISSSMNVCTKVKITLIMMLMNIGKWIIQSETICVGLEFERFIVVFCVVLFIFWFFRLKRIHVSMLSGPSLEVAGLNYMDGWLWLCTLCNIHYDDFQLPERGTPLHRTIMTSSVSKVLSSPIGLHSDYHCSPTTIQKRRNSQIGIIFPHILMCPHPLILYDFHLPIRWPYYKIWPDFVSRAPID